MIRRAEVVTGLELPSVLAFQKTLRMMCVFGNVLALIAVEQERLVKANNLVLDHVTTRAVVNVWGEPPHHRSQFTHFFVMSDQRMIPSMRVVTGETPRGWSAEVHAGEGLFFAYPDRGWLLVFLEERLVYKEELKAEELRTIVETWAYEDRFKTRLEGAPGP
ncbi:MAG: hypothetical protein HP498_00620 [Nitrospira sp.]|nr:hypothetical protein [Nitrospira sp.]